MEGTCLELGTAEALQLPGFGVELAIKNMEYSAVDDTKVGPSSCNKHGLRETQGELGDILCSKAAAFEHAAGHQQDGAGAMRGL